MGKDNSKKKIILDLIYSAIDTYNMMNPEELHIKKSLDSPIMGADSVLDSLGLLTFLVDLEDKIKKELNLSDNLINEELLANNSQKYKDVGSILDLILTLN